MHTSKVQSPPSWAHAGARRARSATAAASTYHVIRTWGLSPVTEADPLRKCNARARIEDDRAARPSVRLQCFEGSRLT
eukprot:69775-Chlamydomonas_euryale.AAC.3